MTSVKTRPMAFELSIYLDLVRTLAAFMVFISHVSNATKGPLWHVSGHAKEAVVIFFVLSGFVIGHVAATREGTASSYAVARLARIGSVAIPAIAITLVLDWIGMHYGDAADLYHAARHARRDPEIMDVLRSLLFLNETWNDHIVVGTNEPYWSLGFEVWYYVIFGIVLFAPPLIGIAGAAAVLLAIGPKVAVLFPLWLLGLACHRVIARAAQAGHPLMPRAAGAAVFAASILLYATMYAQVPLRDAYDPFELSAAAMVTWLYCYAVALLFAANLIGFSVIGPWLHAPARRSAPAIRWFAGASFSLYLFHQPVVIFLISVLPVDPGRSFGTVVIVVAALALVLALAEFTERRKRAWQRLFEAVPFLGPRRP